MHFHFIAQGNRPRLVVPGEKACGAIEEARVRDSSVSIGAPMM
jgi:hypothetical protein